MSLIQKTISNKISFSGIGLHSGKKVTINLLPEKTNEGINFVFQNSKIKALWKNAEISNLCTKLKKKNFFVFTIEHLMSALYGLGINNLLIETSSNEIPILDGSSLEFVSEIEKVGLIEQNVEVKFLKILKEVTYELNNKYIKILPSEAMVIDYTLDYKDEFIKKQRYVYEHNKENYLKICKARTFCLHEDLEKIFAMGLGKGGSLDNAIVVSGKKILNQGGLRLENEFVKHKILDCIGDLYLSGYQLIGKVITYGGGHEMNLMLLKEIFKNNSNYKVI